MENKSISELYREYYDIKDRYVRLVNQYGGACSCREITNVNSGDEEKIIEVHTTGMNDTNIFESWNGETDMGNIYKCIRAYIPKEYKLNITHYDTFAADKTVDKLGTLVEGDTQNMVNRWYTLTDLIKLCTKSNTREGLLNKDDRKLHILCDFAHIMGYVGNDKKIIGNNSITVGYRSGTELADINALDDMHMRIGMDDISPFIIVPNVSCLHLGYTNLSFFANMFNDPTKPDQRMSFVELNDDKTFINTLTHKMLSIPGDIEGMDEILDNVPKYNFINVKIWTRMNIITKKQDTTIRRLYLRFPKIDLLNGDKIDSVKKMLFILYSISENLRNTGKDNGPYYHKIISQVSAGKTGAFMLPSNKKLELGLKIPSGAALSNFYSDLRDKNVFPLSPTGEFLNEYVLDNTGRPLRDSAGDIIIVPFDKKEEDYMLLAAFRSRMS